VFVPSSLFISKIISKFKNVTVFLSFIVLHPSNLQAATCDGVEITAWSLNVRSGPANTHRKLGTVNKYERYTVIEQNGDWKKIWFDEYPGWVFSPKYTKKVSAHCRKIKGLNYLNVRKGPGTGYSKVGQAQRASTWFVLSSSGSWKKIYYKSEKRWVYSQYLDSHSNVSAPKITSAAMISVYKNKPYLYNVNAVDADIAENLSFHLTDAPESMTIVAATGKISWQPTENNIGEHTITVTVTDLAGLQDSQTFTLKVIDKKTNPHISPANIVVLMDESGSMRGEQTWITQTIPALNDVLIVKRIEINAKAQQDQFGLIGFGQFDTLLNPIKIGQADFGSVNEFVTAAKNLVAAGKRKMVGLQ
jgi:uncharacterized protein YraI